MRDAKDLTSMDGMEYLASAPDGEIIKDMVVHNDVLFVATDKHLYVLKDNKRLELVKETEWKPLDFPTD